jgi:hypothetical protein
MGAHPSRPGTQQAVGRFHFAETTREQLHVIVEKDDQVSEDMAEAKVALAGQPPHSRREAEILERFGWSINDPRGCQKTLRRIFSAGVYHNQLHRPRLLPGEGE